MHPAILHPVVAPEDVAAVSLAASSPARAMEAMSGLRSWLVRSMGAPDCVLTSSCTQALRIALSVLIHERGEVVVPDLTFIATAHAALAAGHCPRLVDVQADTLHLSPPGSPGWPDSAAAVVPVELLGRPISNDLVEDLADYGVPIIVDAAQSVGATRWRPAYRAMCVSFAANKIIHGHQGGAILCSEADGDHLRKYLRHGRSGDGYHHDAPGENAVMNPLGAALSLSQAGRIEEIMERRRRLSEHYAELGAVSPLPGDPGNRWVCVARRTTEIRPCCDLWEPLHGQPHLRDFAQAACPNADKAFAEIVALPSSDDWRP